VLSCLRRRWLRLAVAILTASGGLAACTGETTSALLVFEVDDERHRPAYILFGWRAPGGGGVDDVRLPEQGTLPASGRLGSVHIQLRDDRPGVREVLAQGMRGGALVSAARGEIPWRPGEQTTVTLTLSCAGAAGTVADPAGCLTPGGTGDGGARDAAGEAPGAADAGAGADAPVSGDGGAAPPDQGPGEPMAADARIDAGGRDAPADRGPGLVLDGPRPADAPPGMDTGPALPPPGTRLGAGLVVYFRLDDGAGSGTAADSSGNGNLGTLANLDVSRAWVPGRFGQAVQLPGGAAPGWLSVAASPSLNRISTGLSVSVWVRAGNPVGDWRATIVARRSVGAGGFLYSLHVLDGRPGFWLNSSHGARADGSGGQPLPRDRWVHLALVHDDPQASARLYQDGDLIAQDESLLGFGPENAPLVVGGSQGSGPGAVIDPFAGAVDELAIYDRPLSVAEVQALAGGFRP
jgi:hypothetical protein